MRRTLSEASLSRPQGEPGCTPRTGPPRAPGRAAAAWRGWGVTWGPARLGGVGLPRPRRPRGVRQRLLGAGGAVLLPLVRRSPGVGCLNRCVDGPPGSGPDHGQVFGGAVQPALVGLDRGDEDD